ELNHAAEAAQANELSVLSLFRSPGYSVQESSVLAVVRLAAVLSATPHTDEEQKRDDGSDDEEKHPVFTHSNQNDQKKEEGRRQQQHLFVCSGFNKMYDCG
ncbi:unnamed protein product, partial [Heterosigma akashiwo]